ERAYRGGENGLVARGRDLEEDEVQLLEPDLLVVRPPRCEHGSIEPDQVLGAQTAPAGGGGGGLHGGHAGVSRTREGQYPAQFNGHARAPATARGSSGDARGAGRGSRPASAGPR